MNYTIKIAGNAEEGEKLIRQIESIVGDSSFVTIYEEESGLSEDMVRELDSRYEQAMKNPADGQSWEEVKAGLKKPGQVNP